jgi:hypothetical protein
MGDLVKHPSGHLQGGEEYLCWLHSISVPKKNAHDGSTDSFSLQFLHQISGAKISCLIVYILILERICFVASTASNMTVFVTGEA